MQPLCAINLLLAIIFFVFIDLTSKITSNGFCFRLLSEVIRTTTAFQTNKARANKYVEIVTKLCIRIEIKQTCMYIIADWRSGTYLGALVI